jgi:class 3 adenylate cyclase
MSAEIRNLAILIANISNSMRLHEDLGDAVAHAKIQSCQNIISSIADEYDGNVVSSVGDQIMCTFPSADHAANAAIMMNKVLNNGSHKTINVEDKPVSIHVGLHYGPAISQNRNNVYGSAVNIASRLAELAQNNYIFTSGSTVEMLSPELQELSYFVNSASIKGEKKNVELFEIYWQQYQ